MAGSFSSIMAASLVAILSALPAWAEESVDCATATAQQDVNLCLAVENSGLKDAMAKAYQDAASRQEELFKDDEEAAGKMSQALSDGELAFESYMKHQCTAEGYQAMGGTLEAQLVGECVKRLVKARIAELEALTEGLGN